MFLRYCSLAKILCQGNQMSNDFVHDLGLFTSQYELDFYTVYSPLRCSSGSIDTGFVFHNFFQIRQEQY